MVALAERMEDRHQRLEEHRDAVHLQGHPETLTSTNFRGANPMGRYLALSSSDPTCKVDSVL